MIFSSFLKFKSIIDILFGEDKISDGHIINFGRQKHFHSIIYSLNNRLVMIIQRCVDKYWNTCFFMKFPEKSIKKWIIFMIYCLIPRSCITMRNSD